jgi:hypothetical protein
LTKSFKGIPEFSVDRPHGFRAGLDATDKLIVVSELPISGLLGSYVVITKNAGFAKSRSLSKPQ